MAGLSEVSSMEEGHSKAQQMDPGIGDSNQDQCQEETTQSGSVTDEDESSKPCGMGCLRCRGVVCKFCPSNPDDFFLRLGTLIAMLGTCWATVLALFKNMENGDWKAVIVTGVVLGVVKVPTTLVLLFFFIKRPIRALRELSKKNLREELAKKIGDVKQTVIESKGKINSAFVSDPNDKKMPEDNGEEPKHSYSDVKESAKALELILYPPPDDTTLNLDKEVDRTGQGDRGPPGSESESDEKGQGHQHKSSGIFSISGKGGISKRLRTWRNKRKQSSNATPEEVTD